MKTTKELLSLLKEECINTNRDITGLCAKNYDLVIGDIITVEEFEKLKRYITDNEPSFYKKGMHMFTNSAYYWTIGLRKPRIK